MLERDQSLIAALELIANPGHLLVENIAVIPQCQGSGIGRHLMLFAECEAKRQGAAKFVSTQMSALRRTLLSIPGWATAKRTASKSLARLSFICQSLFTLIRRRRTAPITMTPESAPNADARWIALSVSRPVSADVNGRSGSLAVVGDCPLSANWRHSAATRNYTESGHPPAGEVKFRVRGVRMVQLALVDEANSLVDRVNVHWRR